MSGTPTPVFMLCTEVPPHVVGGLGRYAERMIGRLAAAGVPVTVLGLDPTGTAPRRERHGPVTVHRLRPLLRRTTPTARGPRLVARNLAYSARAVRTVLAAPRAVVAVHDWMGCLAGIACRLTGRPVVFHVHNCELSTPPRSLLGRALAALETAQARLAAAVIVPSSTLRDQLVARGWPADRIRVVGHGAGDPELDRLAALPGPELAARAAAVRARYPAGKLVVYAGRLSAAKGVPTLLAALPRLPGTTLVLCGDGSPHTDERARVAAAAGPDVVLRPFLPAAELYGLFLAADACVFPSAYEPFGLVALEAMALGRPVVLGPGYAPEVAGPALRATRDDPAELAALLRRALAGEAPDLRAHARTFDWDRTVAATLACYAEVAGR